MMGDLRDMYPLEFGNEWDDEEYDDWTEEEEEDLIADGICPECGADLDLCGHGIDLHDYSEDGDYVEDGDDD